MTPTVTSVNGRSFSTFPVAVQAVIVNEQGQVLLLYSPHRYAQETWQVISGGLEANETILQGILREVREEAGEEVKIRPLGLVHAQTFHYDANVRYMLGLYYLLAYEGGQITPGDDMRDSHYRWFSLDQLDTLHFFIPDLSWLLKRAVSLYHLWKDTNAPLQPNL